MIPYRSPIAATGKTEGLRAPVLRGRKTTRPAAIARGRIVLAAAWLALPLAFASAADYVTEVRPILSAKCFACHGPDELTREADLRLDNADAATADLGGYAAIVPGEPDESEVILRVESDDEDLLMPPPDSGKLLEPEEIATLREWIAEGGKYQPHWAFERVESPTPPDAVDDQAVSPIDRFVRRRLDKEGLPPAPPANPYTLIRRVYLDLIGLPPTPEEADEFASEPSEAAYQRLVERLLASEHYGERWARPWLDLARYSDTKGYEKDRPRTMWPYRDWVIDAVNADMPFDRFTIEQIAGDMLPDPTVDQLVATGFHRNTMTNEEGGIDPQEFRYLSVVDRVATTGATWLGLTLGCAQCHTHKYDPVTHQDYFAFFALYNNADEVSVPLASEDSQPDSEQSISDLEAQRAERLLAMMATTEDAPRRAFANARSAWVEARRSDTPAWEIARPTSVETNLPTTEVLDDSSVLVSGDVTNADKYLVALSPEIRRITAVRVEALPHPSLPNGGSGRRTIGEDNGRGLGSFLLTEVLAHVVGNGEPQPIELAGASASYLVDELEASLAIDGRLDTGWTVQGRQRQRQTLVVRLAEPVKLHEGEQIRVTLRHDSFYPAGLGRFRLSVTDKPGPIVAHGLTDDAIAALHLPEADRDSEQRRMLTDAFLSTAPELEDENRRIADLRNTPPGETRALVMQERVTNPRVTHRRHRGEYLKQREEVAPNTPSFLPALPSEAKRDRLALARWLVSRDNPLTARVVVNRDWQAFFGRGLVKTTADFGMQGEYPTHPELLDWLAADFMEGGWSRKRLHRQIVTSATYRQSAVNPKAQSADPENRLLARMSRLRIDAEQVRDVILSASGLLTDKIGGPSVFPPQPPGITEAAYGPLRWVVSEGEDRYRRGLYTFNKRTAPYAAFGLFDAPSGEVCVPRRNRSNTPLQALALLNDEVVNEAARALAAELTAAPAGDNELAERALRRAFTRPAEPSEIDAVVAFVRTQRERLSSEELSALSLLNTGPKRSWTFDTETGGWSARNDADVRLDGGALVVTSTGGDPHIGVDFEGPAGEYTFRFTAESDRPLTYEVYWTTEREPLESPDRRVVIAAPDRSLQEQRATIVVDSPLRSVRLDTGGEPGETRLHEASLACGDESFDLAAVRDPAELAAWQLAARVVLNLDEVVTKP